MADLGTNIATALPIVSDLILQTRDADERRKLRALHKRLSNQLKKLVEGSVLKKTQEYKKANARLEEANQALRAAKRDIAKLADGIKKLAKGVDFVAKVAAIAV
jgi:hypothetical protein